jgi:hypothetical protein
MGGRRSQRSIPGNQIVIQYTLFYIPSHTLDLDYGRTPSGFSGWVHLTHFLFEIEMPIIPTFSGSEIRWENVPQDYVQDGLPGGFLYFLFQDFCTGFLPFYIFLYFSLSGRTVYVSRISSPIP